MVVIATVLYGINPLTARQQLVLELVKSRVSVLG